MAAFKDKKNGSWYVQFRYTDWRGERQQKLKRGFATKKEAQAWEREFLMQKQADVNMSFESFVALYEKDVKPKLKLNTWLSKEHIIRTKILPYFKKRKLSEITARDVIDWQNEIRQHTKSSGESYSPDYLKNVHTQLSCIFNHAIKYYGLQINPAAKAGNMGSEQPKEMLFWTKEEYLKFIDAMMDKPMLYYAFEILYWCGIREGELLALTPADFDFEKKTLRINKSYQRLQGKDVITTPKTKKSNRVIQMPDFLCDEIQDYFKQLYGLESDSRIFPLSKYALKRGMAFGCKASGAKVIRIHDLRHPYVKPTTKIFSFCYLGLQDFFLCGSLRPVLPSTQCGKDRMPQQLLKHKRIPTAVHQIFAGKGMPEQVNAYLLYTTGAIIMSNSQPQSVLREHFPILIAEQIFPKKQSDFGFWSKRESSSSV